MGVRLPSWLLRNPIIAWMLGVGLTSFALLAGFEAWWPGPPSPLASGVQHLLTAVMTAAVIGTTADLMVKQEIIRDVFETAMGFLLPEHLRPAMRWIYNQRIICVSHTQTCELFSNNDGAVRMVMQVHRVLENRGASAEQIVVGVGADEWFEPAARTEILELGYEHQDNPHQTTDFELAAELPPHSPATKGQKVTIPAQKKLTVWSRFQEIKRPNDDTYMLFHFTTVKPRVIVRSCEGIDAEPKFHSADEGDQIRHQGTDTWVFEGTLLPFQAIQIRWWRTEDEAKFREAAPAVAPKEVQSGPKNYVGSGSVIVHPSAPPPGSDKL